MASFSTLPQAEAIGIRIKTINQSIDQSIGKSNEWVNEQTRARKLIAVDFLWGYFL